MNGLTLYYMIIAFISAAALGYGIVFTARGVSPRLTARAKIWLRAAAVYIVAAPGLALGVALGALLYALATWAAALAAVLDEIGGNHESEQND